MKKIKKTIASTLAFTTMFTTTFITLGNPIEAEAIIGIDSSNPYSLKLYDVTKIDSNGEFWVRWSRGGVGYTDAFCISSSNSSYWIASYYNNWTGAVEHLQMCLRPLGYDLAIDGSYGPSTKAAVMDIQRKHLTISEVDGSVGPTTWRIIYSLLRQKVGYTF